MQRHAMQRAGTAGPDINRRRTKTQDTQRPGAAVTDEDACGLAEPPHRQELERWRVRQRSSMSPGRQQNSSPGTSEGRPNCFSRRQRWGNYSRKSEGEDMKEETEKRSRRRRGRSSTASAEKRQGYYASAKKNQSWQNCERRQIEGRARQGREEIVAQQGRTKKRLDQGGKKTGEEAESSQCLRMSHRTQATNTRRKKREELAAGLARPTRRGTRPADHRNQHEACCEVRHDPQRAALAGPDTINGRREAEDGTQGRGQGRRRESLQKNNKYTTTKMKKARRKAPTATSTS
jgi:hypothetical protein